MSIYGYKENQLKFKRVAENMSSGIFKHNDVSQEVDHFNDDVNKAVRKILSELENEK